MPMLFKQGPMGLREGDVRKTAWGSSGPLPCFSHNNPACSGLFTRVSWRFPLRQVLPKSLEMTCHLAYPRREGDLPGETLPTAPSSGPGRVFFQWPSQELQGLETSPTGSDISPALMTLIGCCNQWHSEERWPCSQAEIWVRPGDEAAGSLCPVQRPMVRLEDNFLAWDGNLGTCQLSLLPLWISSIKHCVQSLPSAL